MDSKLKVNECFSIGDFAKDQFQNCIKLFADKKCLTYNSGYKYTVFKLLMKVIQKIMLLMLNFHGANTMRYFSTLQLSVFEVMKTMQ